MQITQEFELSFPPADAYERLLEIEQVVPCMPGAQLGPQRDDGSYEVTVTTKLGPMRFTYVGDVRVVEVNRERRSAVLKGSAREQRGQGAAEATIEMVVSGDRAPAKVAATAEIALTGRAAQMGHGAIEPVAAQLIAEMVAELERRVSTPPATAAQPESDHGPARPPAARQSELHGGRFAFAVFRRWLRQVLRSRRGAKEGSSR